MIYLVSHAHSAARDQWDMADHLRPLSPRGWRQAVALARRMSGVTITSVLASPTHRGVQTVSGLALRRGLAVVTEPRLRREATADEISGLLREQPADGAVLCTHAALVALVLGGLGRRGDPAGGPADPPLPGVWALTLTDGEVAAVEHRPPVIPAPRTHNSAAPAEAW